jgi:signal transduction histidine kinase
MGPTLFLAFSAAAVPVLVASGALIEWQARRSLEMELGRRVESLAAAVSAAIPEETWSLLFSLGPGDEETRAARLLRSRLAGLAAGAGAERIEIWTPTGRIALDQDGALPIGSPAPRARLMGTELDAALRQGRASSAPLFRSESGRWVKVGAAPIGGAMTSGEAQDQRGSGPARSDVRSSPLGLVVVSVPSESLGAIGAMRRTLLLAGICGWLLFLLTAVWLARGTTRRIRHLTASALAIGRGDLETPVRPAGQDEIGILADALDRMRAAVEVRERQLRAMVGGVAHEIRNPLGGLTLYAEMLSREVGLSEKQRQWAQRILGEAMRLERVVKDFLEYARPERPRLQAVDLGALAAETAQNAALGLDWHGELTLAPGAGNAECDPDHVRQILLNLLRNAMQAAGPTGHVRVSGELREGAWELQVEDSGPGVSAAERERIFEPFYSSKADGAGLGLSIARRLCDLGEIGLGLDASPLGGARFVLRFARRPGAAGGPVAP